MLNPQHGDGDSDASTSDSEGGRDEIIRDADDYNNSPTDIHRGRHCRCRTVKINGTDVVVPEDQIEYLKNPPGYAK